MNNFLIPFISIGLFQEIKDRDVMCKALECAYQLLIAPESINFITDIFQYAENLLITYRTKIGIIRIDFHRKIIIILASKICHIEIIRHLLTMVKVVVQNKQHAIVRLHFWWKFICSVDGEFVCDSKFSSVTLGFLLFY